MTEKNWYHYNFINPIRGIKLFVANTTTKEAFKDLIVEVLGCFPASAKENISENRPDGIFTFNQTYTFEAWRDRQFRISRKDLIILNTDPLDEGEYDEKEP